MNTQEAKELALANQNEFIQWAEDWHGEHKVNKCDIKHALVKYSTGHATFDEVFEAVKETDGDFDSFRFYIENNTYADNHLL